MTMWKISVPGKYIIIAPREEAGRSLPAISSGFTREPGCITRTSSSIAQPFVAANFSADGFVGGKTITKKEQSAIIATAKKEGAHIEELP